MRDRNFGSVTKCSALQVAALGTVGVAVHLAIPEREHLYFSPGRLHLIYRRRDFAHTHSSLSGNDVVVVFFLGWCACSTNGHSHGYVSETELNQLRNIWLPRWRG